ncbi:hypothetical protein [Actinomadura opuntiae]|nr:hypothetical protein [Actinomadura sp. OS1-43]MDL4819105.1 hypothetical protein [Actinomadura sp. OS1-43]
MALQPVTSTYPGAASALDAATAALAAQAGELFADDIAAGRHPII